MSWKDTDEQRLIHCTSDNINIIIGNKEKEIIQDLFKYNK